jgi:GH25 family lysozyme M1 (1,4-beta-N-acetylmuramidase)
VLKDKSGAVVEKCIDCKVIPTETQPIPNMHVAVDKDSCKVGEDVRVAANFFGKNPASEIRFYAYNPSSAYQEEIGRFATGVATWRPTKAGNYLVFAAGRDTARQILEGYVPVQVTEQPQITYLGFGASHPSPQRAGTTISLNAAAQCLDGSKPSFRFYALDVASGNTEEIKPYNEENTATWTPSSGGQYLLYVTIKDASGHVIEKAIDFTVISLERIRGMDVSDLQGSIDFNEAKKQGVEFVMIRCGYGDDIPGQDDYQFLDNVRKAKAAGIHMGVTHFFYGATVDKARGEARHCLRLIHEAEKDYGRPLFTYPIALDIENDERCSFKLSSLPRDVLTENIKEWAKVISAAGYLPMIYINPTWIRNQINFERIKEAGILLWLAQWKVDVPDYDCDIWQWAGGDLGNGPQYGAQSKGVDLDISFTDFPRMMRERHLNGF